MLRIASPLLSILVVALPPLIGFCQEPITNKFAVPSFGTSICQPFSTELIDLNSDGILDLVASGSEGVSVRLGLGNESFDLEEYYEIDFGTRRFVAGDLDGDQDLDLAVLARESVFIFLNDGGGKFNVSPTLVFENGNLGQSIATGDLDSDGDLDLAMFAESNLVVMLSNDGNAAFKPFKNINTTSLPSDILIADFDNNSKADLFISQGIQYRLHLQAADGQFVMKSGFLGGEICDAEAADLDNDDDIDLAIARNDQLCVMLNNGSGDFTNPVCYGSKFDSLQFLGAGDVNGDGYLDIAGTSEKQQIVDVFTNNSDGTFSGPQRYFVGCDNKNIFFNDYNNDGFAEVMFGAERAIGVIRNNRGQLLVNSRIETQRVSDMTLVSIDDDSHIDVALCGSAFDRIRTFRNNGDGTLSELQSLQLENGEGPTDIYSADLNGDGLADLITRNRDTDDIGIAFNDGNGTFAIDRKYAAGIDPRNVALGDLDGDGDIDFAVSDIDSDAVIVRFNDGFGQFDAFTSYAAGEEPRLIAAVDVDSDDDMDLVVVDATTVGVLENERNRFFKFAPMADITPNIPIALTTGDINGDRETDVVLSTSFGIRGTLFSFINENGTFIKLATYATSAHHGDIKTVDLNQDGILDVIGTHFISGTAAVYYGKGDGTFLPKYEYSSGTCGITSIEALDLDNDDDLDLLTGGNAFSVSGSLEIMLNNSTLLGDINLDGDVDLLDVSPFVELLVDGQFQPEADINFDRALDLLDIAGFVTLLID